MKVNESIRCSEQHAGTGHWLDVQSKLNLKCPESHGTIFRGLETCPGVKKEMAGTSRQDQEPDFRAEQKLQNRMDSKYKFQKTRSMYTKGALKARLCRAPTEQN